MTLLKGGAVHLSQLNWIKADKLRLDLLQQGFNLPLLPLLHTTIWICIQTIEIWLTRTWKQIHEIVIKRQRLMQCANAFHLKHFFICSYGEMVSNLELACW